MNTEINSKEELEGILFDPERKYVIKSLVPAVFNALRGYTETDNNDKLGVLMGIKSGSIAISQMKNQRHPLKLSVEKLQNLAGNLNVSFEKIIDILREKIMSIEDTSPGKEKFKAFFAGLQKRTKLFSNFDFEPKLNGKKATFMETGVVPIEWLNLIPEHDERISLLVEHCGKSSTCISKGRKKEENSPREKRNYRKRGQMGDDVTGMTGNDEQIAGQSENNTLLAATISGTENESTPEFALTGGTVDAAADEVGEAQSDFESKNSSVETVDVNDSANQFLKDVAEEQGLLALTNLVAVSEELVNEKKTGKDESSVKESIGLKTGEKEQSTSKSKENGSVLFGSLKEIQLLNAITQASQNVGEAKRSKLGMCADVFLGTLSRQMARRNYTVTIKTIREQSVGGRVVEKGITSEESIDSKDREMTLVTFNDNKTGDSFCWKVDLAEFLSDRLEIGKKNNGIPR